MSDLAVLNVGEVEKVEINAADKIIFNGGLVKIQELTDKLNALKDTVNSLIQAYNTHTHERDTKCFKRANARRHE
jgi:hypothetical protein